MKYNLQRFAQDYKLSLSNSILRPDRILNAPPLCNTTAPILPPSVDLALSSVSLQQLSPATFSQQPPWNSIAMAPMSNQSINYSSNYGEDLTARVNVLASCYVVDSAANLKGLHYCTTGVTGTSKSQPQNEVSSKIIMLIFSLCLLYRGGVVFLRSLPQACLLLLQVPPSPH